MKNTLIIEENRYYYDQIDTDGDVYETAKGFLVPEGSDIELKLKEIAEKRLNELLEDGNDCFLENYEGDWHILFENDTEFAKLFRALMVQTIE